MRARIMISTLNQRGQDDNPEMWGVGYAMKPVPTVMVLHGQDWKGFKHIRLFYDNLDELSDNIKAAKKVRKKSRHS